MDRYVFGTNKDNYNIGKFADTEPDAYMTLLKRRPPTASYIVDNLLYRDLSEIGTLNTAYKLSTNYIFFLTPHTATKNIDCLHNLNCKEIGVTDLTAYTFLVALQKGYRIFPDRVRLHWIPSTDRKRLHVPEVYKKFDLIATSVDPSSKYGNYILDSRLALLAFNENVDWDRVRIFLPNLTVDPSVDLKRKFGAGLSYPTKFGTLVRFQPQVIRFASQLEGFTVSPVNLVRDEQDNDDTGYMFRCLGDPYAKTKDECISPTDTTGKPRTKPAYWDSPCLQDADCPYWDPVRNRGGCFQGGFCEMPVGVQRNGFRNHNSEPPYQPFCHGCDPYNISCCYQTQRPKWVFKGETWDN